MNEKRFRKLEKIILGASIAFFVFHGCTGCSSYKFKFGVQEPKDYDHAHINKYGGVAKYCFGPCSD